MISRTTTRATAFSAIRCWDSCMYSDFTKMAARQPQNDASSQRFRQRFMHKLVYFPDEQRRHVFGCVGCGRCLAKCPISHEYRQGHQGVWEEVQLKCMHEHETFDPAVSASSRISVRTRRTSRHSASSAWTARSSLSISPASAPCSPSPAWARRMFSITSSPHERRISWNFRIKKCGCLTAWLHSHGGGPADHRPRPVRQRLPG